MYEEKEPKKKVKKEKAKKVYTEKNIKSKVKQAKEEKKESTKEETTKKDTKTTNKVMSFKADWVGILIKFGIFLLIAFFIIFVVTKIKTFKGDSLTKNVEKMKTAAINYFDDEERRPYDVNEEVTLTLDDMINSNLITELKDGKKVCSKEYSNVSLVKKNNDNDYELNIFLSCGGKSKRATYPLSYNEENKEKTILYEQTRTVTNERYTCPEGYLVAGKYCIKEKTTETVKATAKYRVTPEINTRAIHKTGSVSYEKIMPIVATTLNSYTCPDGYALENNKCKKTIAASASKNKSYSCSNGGVPDGSLCIFTTIPNTNNSNRYCIHGDLINGDTCYIKKDVLIKCKTGKYDKNAHACYTTYVPKKELSDWLFDSQVTYSSNITPKDTNTIKYEKITTNGDKIVYKKYVKKYEYLCDYGDDISGNTCKHYNEILEEKSCPTGYKFNNDLTECYKTVAASKRNKNVTSITCPRGYKKKKIDGDVTCYRYEKATQTSTPTYSCPDNYDITENNECVKTMEATKVQEQISYSCPDGYTKRGSGDKTRCYKKVTGNDYYYCVNQKATLSGDRCIIPSKTTFVRYTCPSGYRLSGQTCYKEVKGENILATENDPNTKKTETIWSKEKELDGWTFTGNTKEE